MLGVVTRAAAAEDEDAGPAAADEEEETVGVGLGLTVSEGDLGGGLLGPAPLATAAVAANWLWMGLGEPLEEDGARSLTVVGRGGTPG